MGFGTIFFIVVAAVVLYQLRSVLGRRTGHERPPYDPYSRTNDNPTPPREQGNVVTLPSRRVPAEEAPGRFEAIDKAAPLGSPANAGLRRIQEADPSFDLDQFLNGARAAYEMVVTGFADGDRKLLKNLLSPEVYQGFESSIIEREARGERMQSSFVGIDNATVVAAELKGRDAFVTLRIVSQLISATLKSNGEVVDGDPETVAEVRDVWTFARDTRSRDPNWKLVETESEE
ncbi:Tim44/TimA family putative adaptor protein [Aureimonas sp. AU40]|uniref:Tim44/TimA family putative adaptor protein n=1 Tax=Aureimonas sp. AU40 TaxID=1637747 RepID=UPI000782161E|nr:Tim44/TimA family putative adaptor protein [Aureimonas sp. AU40]